MQDAEKLQLAVEQMQQIVDKAHQIIHDPNLPNLLAAYDVARDCILQGSLDEIATNRIGNCSSDLRFFSTRALHYRVVLESTLTPDSVPFGAPLLRTSGNSQASAAPRRMSAAFAQPAMGAQRAPHVAVRAIRSQGCSLRSGRIDSPFCSTRSEES